MKYRILGLIAGLLMILAAIAPGPLRHLLLKAKSAMYLFFG